MLNAKFVRLLCFLLSGNVIFYYIISGDWNNYYLAGYVLLNLLIFFIVLKKTRRYLAFIQNALGNLNTDKFNPERYTKIADTDPLVSELLLNYRKNNEELDNLKGIFKENYEPSFNYIRETDAFAKMIENIREELTTQRQEERTRNWIVEGLASFGKLIRNEEHDLSKLGSLLLSRLVKYTNCNQGAIFISGEDDEGNKFMERLSCYAFERERFGEKIVKAGNGLLGQCMLEQDTIYLKRVPESYVRITSGLGGATPTNILIVPLMANEVFYGAIELASFNNLENHHINFVEKLAENLALAVASFQGKRHMQNLLEESQKLSNELRDKETETQESLDKLTMMQDEMHHHQMELDGLFRAINNYLVTAEIDMEGKIAGTNKNLLHLFGYKYEEVIGLSITELLSNKGILSGRFWENLNMGHAISEDLLCQTKKRRPFWLRVSFTPVEDVTGSICKVLMLAEDITIKKLQEVELQGHLQAIDNTIAAIEFSMNGIIQRVNPIYSGIMGYKSGELQGKSYSVLLSSREKNNSQSMLLWENLRSGQFFAGTFKQVDKQGKEQWLNGTFNPIFDIDGKPKKVLMFADFITKEREKQNELQGMVNALKASFPCLELDANARIKSANKLFFEMFKYKRLELQKKDLGQLMTTDSFNKFNSALEEFKSNNFRRETFNWVTPDGKATPFEVTISAINDLENGIDKILLIFTSSPKVVVNPPVPMPKNKAS